MRSRPKDRGTDRRAFRAGRSAQKTIWHPLSLQQLNPRQFVDIVNGILDGTNEVYSGTLRGTTALMLDSKPQPVLNQVEQLH
jgi:hypothetical protein